MAKWWICWTSRFAEVARRHGPPILLFAALSVALTWPVALTASSHLENDGDAVLNAWTLGWVATHLRHPAQLPHAPNFYPYPYTLYFSEHLIGAALLIAPVIGLTGNPVLAYNVLFLSAFVLSAGSMYALVSWMTGDRSAAMLSGMLFASMTLRFGPSPQLQVLLNFGIPLALLFFLRALRTGRCRDVVGLGGVFALQFLISLYHGLFTAVGLISVGAEQLMRNPRARRAALWGRIALAMAAAAGLLLPVTWPYLEARRWVGARGLDQQALFGALSYLLVPHGHLYAALPPFREVHRYAHIETLFPGVVPLALAAYGLWRSRSPWRRPFALLLALGWIFSLGPALRLRLEDPPLIPAMPYVLLWRFFPGFQAIRVPARMFVLAQLGLAGLAGLGWHAWHPRRIPRAGGVLAVLALATLEAYRGPFPRYPAPQPLPDLDRHLASHRPTSPFIELPTLRTLDVLSDAETMRRLTHAQFATLYRGQPTPIGYSGFFPPLFWEVADRLLVFPSRESLAFLEDLGVRAILVRTDGWAPGEREALEARWALFRDSFEREAETPAGTLYWIRERPRSTVGEIDVTGVPVGDRIWIFLNLPRGAWPWRISITPGRYRLEITPLNRASVPPSYVLEGALPRVLPFYLEKLPIGVLPLPADIQAFKVEGWVEGGDSGRLELPPARRILLRRVVFLEEPLSALPATYRMPMIEFQNGIVLGVIALSGEAFCPGEALEFTMLWNVRDVQAFQAQERVPVVFLHLHDRGGRMVGGRDLPLDFGIKSFREWGPGEVIAQGYRVTLPLDLPPGPASMVIGLYPLGQPEPGSRWPIRSARAPLWEHAAAVGATIEILPSPCRIPEGR
ncbi:hypothetical protein [Thermoflexus sp.]|uniref:hypothetical protein n=1 Tax=Thermoflexus sp. TaxID=1969742 RepID=UPI00175ED552|nr:hypothetical protein [Thermoflexus sp.]